MNQWTTLRSIDRCGASSGTSAGIHGPAASTSRAAAIVSPPARTRTPSVPRVPALDGDAGPQFGAVPPGHVQARGDGARREQHARARLGDGDGAGRDPHGRMAPHHLRRRQHLVGEAVAPRAVERAGDEASSGGPMVRPPVGTSRRVPVSASSACHAA